MFQRKVPAHLNTPTQRSVMKPKEHGASCRFEIESLTLGFLVFVPHSGGCLPLLSALREEMCYWKERQCSHLMDPGCHRLASASLRISEVDHNPEGRCVPTSVIRFEHSWLQAMGTWKGGRLSVYELSFTECASTTLWAAILPDLSPPQHKHPKRQLDITVFQEKES